jgi:hypothetical protein
MKSRLGRARVPLLSVAAACVLGRRCRLGDRGIDNIERDNSRLREQVDRCIEAGG